MRQSISVAMSICVAVGLFAMTLVESNMARSNTMASAIVSPYVHSSFDLWRFGCK